MDDSLDYSKLVTALLDGVLPEEQVRIQAQAKLTAFASPVGVSPLDAAFETTNDVLVTCIHAITPSAATAVTVQIGSRTPIPIPSGFVPLTDVGARIRPTVDKITLTWSGGSDGSLICTGKIVTTKGRP
jgi:hypothetical protein